MAKSDKTVFVCGECGYEAGKWLGKCPGCGSWNTMVEEKAIASPRSHTATAVPLSDVSGADALRVSTGMGELDRVLGGGIVAGSAVLLSGDPGIGKSTLLMQMAGQLTRLGKVLYVTGEESAAQLKLRAERLQITGDMLLLAETDLTAVESEIRRIKPDYLIIDSIQTMYCPELSGAAGSVSQVRESTALLTRLAKASACAVFIVGHVTKEGSIAGPRILEHMVDTVLYFEGDRHDAFRLLRAVKNRFGATSEVGVFEMRDSGMREVPDPSGLFLSGSSQPGCSVTCAMEGTRPLLLEVQALLSTSAFNNPRRMATGLDGSRLVLLLAVLEKRANLKLYDRDVYANVVGGMHLEERAGDLAVALCIASALLDLPLPDKTAVIGELSLTGEVRSVSRLDKRVAECARLGFRNILIPAAAELAAPEKVRLVRVSSLAEAVRCLTGKN